MNITEKLMNIQSELKVPKNNFNSFGNYAFRNAEDIVEAVKPFLIKYGCALIISDSLVCKGEPARFYIEAFAELFDTESEQTLSATGYAREPEERKGMDSSQITGATSSYARKYALNGLFGIDDTKDPDNTNTHGKDDKTVTKPITPVKKKSDL